MKINAYKKFDTKPDKTNTGKSSSSKSSSPPNNKNEQWGGFIDYIVRKVASLVK